jgi:predicted nucleic acid-binding protein
MNYVLDASVALKTVLNEPDSPVARKLLEEHRQQLHELLAPDTFVIEVAHALTRAERRKIIQVGEAPQLLAEIMTYRPILHAYLPLVSRAVELSSQLGVGAYDCLYVALAEREGCSLVTADDRLVNALGNSFSIVPLSAL